MENIAPVDVRTGRRWNIFLAVGFLHLICQTTFGFQFGAGPFFMCSLWCDCRLLLQHVSELPGRLLLPVSTVLLQPGVDGLLVLRCGDDGLEDQFRGSLRFNSRMVWTRPVGVGVSVGATIHRTFEWFLPRVQPLVGLELARLDEGTCAVGVVTRVRSLARVGADVGLQ